MSELNRLLTIQRATQLLAEVLGLTPTAARSRLDALVRKGTVVDELRGKERTRKTPRIVASSLEDFLGPYRSPGADLPTGEILPRLAAVEAFVASRRAAEDDAAVILKAEIDNLRAQLSEEREKRVMAERTTRAIADRLLDFGVDVGELRAASIADRGTLQAYSDALTQLLIPDPGGSNAS